MWKKSLSKKVFEITNKAFKWSDSYFTPAQANRMPQHHPAIQMWQKEGEIE